MTARSVGRCMIYFLGIAFFLVGFYTEAGAGKTPSSPQRGERRVLGDLDLRTPTGEHVSLIPFISREAIVIVFWATECDSCRNEVPRLNKLNADPLTKVIAVNAGEEVRKIRSFMDKHNVQYVVVVDPDASVAKAFQVQAMPSCVILGRSGLIVYRGSHLPEEIDYYLAQ